MALQQSWEPLWRISMPIVAHEKSSRGCPLWCVPVIQRTIYPQWRMHSFFSTRRYAQVRVWTTIVGLCAVSAVSCADEDVRRVLQEGCGAYSRSCAECMGFRDCTWDPGSKHCHPISEERPRLSSCPPEPDGSASEDNGADGRPADHGTRSTDFRICCMWVNSNAGDLVLI